MTANPPGGSAPGGWRAWVRRLKQETLALYLAARDPRTPWYARLVVGVAVAYALSPLDLIPDPIPVLGQLDDLIIVPLLLGLAVRLTPPAVLAECRARAAAEFATDRPTSRLAAAVIVALWLATALLVVWLVLLRDRFA